MVCPRGGYDATLVALGSVSESELDWSVAVAQGLQVSALHALGAGHDAVLAAAG